MTHAADSEANPQPKRPAADVDLGCLTHQLGFVLRLAQVAVFRDLAQALKPSDLTLVDFSILLVIEANPGLKQLAVGDALSIPRPNLVGLIDGLEARGLVQRGTAPLDRRSYALVLTPAGRIELGRAKTAYARHARKLKTALDGADEAALMDALRRIAGI